jgi:protein-L-isoaspartate O-methyltransferase
MTGMVMGFSAIDRRTWLGRAVRWPLSLIPPGTRLPIMQGRLRGYRWIVGSSTHGCWLGSYEREQQRVLERRLASGDVVFDIGSHVGFYTLLASVLVGERGRVVAFEPIPESLRYLDTHLRINAIGNVEVIAAAVSDRAGRARVAAGAASASSSGRSRFG